MLNCVYIVWTEALNLLSHHFKEELMLEIARTMSFSKDDRKAVFDFFVNILLKFREPVFYELLRGHISCAEPKVKEYVRKHCKGEDLLKYFKNRKNYFIVGLRNEVSLKKDRTMALPKRISESSEVHESDSYDYSDSEGTNNSRSSSLSWTNECGNNYSVSSSSMEKYDLEVVAMVYFCDLLGIGKKKIKTLDLASCPPDVRHYITNYLGGNVALLFKDNPEVFRVENGEVWLVNPPETQNVFWKTEDDREPIKPSKSSDEEEAEDVQNFVECSEFFVNLLKKKKSVSLSHLSGSLSKAPSSVSHYLSLNHSSFKDFILEAKGLFTCSENGDVSLTKDCFKLLKRGKKLSHFKSDTIFCSSTVQKQVSEIFGSEPDNKIIETEPKERNSPSNFEKTGSPYSQVSSEDTFYSAEDDIVEDKSGSDLQLAEEEEGKQFSVRSKSVEQVKRDLKFDVVENSEDKQNLVTDQRDLPDEEVENSATNSLALADKVTVESVIELAFCLQFLALERVEKEYILRLNCEYDAVKFFVEILEKNFFPLKSADLNSLKGFLGQASEGVILFMKQLYKGVKISAFFEDYEEFDTRSNFSIVTLSMSYRTYLEEKNILHDDFLKGKKVYDLHNLFNAYLDEVTIDALDCVSKICSFIQNKSRVRLTRLQKIFPQLSASQKDFINSFDGREFPNKLQTFLSHLTIFYVNDECVEINPELNVQLLVDSVNKFCEQLKSLKEKDQLEITFDFLLKLATELKIEEVELNFDCFKAEVIETLKNSFTEAEYLNYSCLPKIVGKTIRYSLLSENSKCLIQFLEDSAVFILENGQVRLKKDCEAAEISQKNDLDETDIETKALDQIDSGKIDSSVEDCNHALDAEVNQNTDSICKDNSETEHLSTSFSRNKDIDAKENETINLNSMNTVASNSNEDNNEMVHEDITKDEVNDEETSMLHDELAMLDQEINSDTSEAISALNALSIENINLENDKFNQEEINFIEESLEKLINADISKITVSDGFQEEPHGAVSLEKLINADISKMKVSYGFYEEPHGVVSLDKATAKLDCDVEMFKQLFDKQSNDEIYDVKLFFQSFKEKLDLEAENSQASISIDDLEAKDRCDVEFQNECKSNKTNASENTNPPPVLENPISELKRQKNNVNSDEMEAITNSEISEIISRNKENVETRNSLLANKQNEHQTPVFEKSLGNSVKCRTYSTNSTDNAERIENSFINEVEISNVLSEITNSVTANKNNNEDLKTDHREDALLKDSSKCKKYLNDSSLQVLDESLDSTETKNKFYDRNKCTTKKKLSDKKSKLGISSKDESKNSFRHFERKNDDSLNVEHLPYDSFKSEVELSDKSNEYDGSTSSKSSSDLFENGQTLPELSGKEKKLKNSSNGIKNPLFLQPLQARITILTLDSCIVETLIEDCKRYVFCLKSTFHCDEHNNCSECFDSLTVGEEVSCYVPPGEDFTSGNICFSIMFCKDSKTGAKEAVIPFVHPSKNAQRKLELEARIKDESLSPPAYKSSNNPNYKAYRVGEVQTDLVGEVKPFCHGVEKACEVKLTSQDSQTTYESNEAESQTILSGSVKSSSLPVADKACSVKRSVSSKSVQVIYDSVDSVCQTVVTGNIKAQPQSSSSESQTALSGQIQKSTHLVDSYCEALPLFDLVSEGTQTIVELDDECEEQDSDAFAAAATSRDNYVPYADDFKDMCNSSCQTIATGPIMIRKYYL